MPRTKSVHSKETQNSGLSQNRTSNPRFPTRERGKLRFKILLDAAEKLLEDQSADSISLYDIAGAAGVPPASVYHFFPTAASAYVALAQRYLDDFKKIIEIPIEQEAIRGWQDIFRIKLGDVCLYFNANTVARKLFLGSEYSWQVKQTNLRVNAEIAEILSNIYNNTYIIADTCILAEKIEIGISIVDCIFALSYARHGIITGEFETEASRAYHAYLSGYIPEFAPRRMAATPDRNAYK